MASEAHWADGPSRDLLSCGFCRAHSFSLEVCSVPTDLWLLGIDELWHRLENEYLLGDDHQICVSVLVKRSPGEAAHRS